MEERVDIINQDGQVIDTCLRTLAKGKLTRWVHIFLFDAEGKWIMQQRAEHKSFRPNLLECAVGGQVAAGETFEAAAARELEEELNVSVPLTYACDSWGDYGLCKVFTGTLTGPLPEPNRDEVAHLVQLTAAEIDFLMEKTPFLIMRGFRDSYSVYKENKNKG